MIGHLLKQLAIALPKFVLYQIRKPFSPAPPPKTPPEPPRSPTDSRAGLPSTKYDGLSSVSLDPSLLNRIPWAAYRNNFPAPDLASEPLYKIWTTNPGSQKWSHYFGVYRTVFEPFRHEALRLLEIGVFRGASLKLWRKYFDNSQTQVIGIDINPACSQFDAPDVGIHVRIGSQTDPGFLKSLIAEFGPFDLIIDDGSHHSSDIITTFNLLFDVGLKDNGIYLAEDLHANYWPDWRDSSNSFLDVCKELLELLNAHYECASSDQFFVRAPSELPFDSLEVPRITTMIKEMRFFDSIVAIYKTKREHVPFMLTGATNSYI